MFCMTTIKRSSKTHSFGFTLIATLLVVPLMTVGVYLALRSNNGNNAVVATTENLTENIQTIPTPFPFQEMTIPALKSRSYKSQLGQLEKLSENAFYTSYMTNYDSDGLKVNGLLTVPKKENGGSLYPAIVFVHGYIPPQEYQTNVNYATYVDYLAKSGLVVFKIDLRGHADSEGEAGGAYYSDDYIVDTLNAVEALRSSEIVDPDLIGLWGHSMGGNVVFRSFAAGNIPAVVIWAGAGYTYSDLQEYMIDDNSYRPQPTDSPRSRERQKLRDAYGNFDSEHWFWKQIPATNYLDGVTGAVQLHHAVDDNVVSIEYSRNLIKALDGSGIKYDLNEYQSGGHNLTGQTFNQAMQKTVEFFKDNLSSK